MGSLMDVWNKLIIHYVPRHKVDHRIEMVSHFAVFKSAIPFLTKYNARVPVQMVALMYMPQLGRCSLKYFKYHIRFNYRFQKHGG